MTIDPNKKTAGNDAKGFEGLNPIPATQNERLEELRAENERLLTQNRLLSDKLHKTDLHVQYLSSLKTLLEEEIYYHKKNQQSANRNHSQLKQFIRQLPISILELNFANVIQTVLEIRQNGVEDLSGFLQDHPEFLKDITSQVRVLNSNPVTIKLFGEYCQDKKLNQVLSMFTDDSWRVVTRLLVSMIEGENQFFSELPIESPDGELHILNLFMGVSPHDEEPFEHVFIALGDITGPKRAEEEIHRLNVDLEKVVKERTKELEIQITERIKTEEALLQSELRFRELFNNLDSGVAFYSPVDDGEDFIIRDMNPAGLRLSHLENVNVIGKRTSTIFPGLQETGVMQALRQVWETGTPFYHPPRHYKDNRLDLWTENQIYKLHSGEVVSIFTDMTDKYNNQEALQASERKFRLIADFTFDWEYWRSPQGEYLYMSPSCERITGYTAAELINNPNIIIDITHPDDRAMMMQHFEQDDTYTDQYTNMIDFRIINRRGEVRWLSHSCQAVFDEQGNYLGRRGSNRDVTDRKVIAEMLQEEREMLAKRVTERTAELSASNAELERALRIRDEFLATMSHELRSPLNAILSLTEILGEGIYGSINDMQSKSLKNIRESGQHLLDLINDILDYSKVDAGKLSLDPQTIWVKDICHSSLRLVREQAFKKSITINLNFDENVVTMQADPRRMKQILVNLLTNAIKFTPNGGKVSLQVHGDPEKEAIHFSVSDTGIGIAHEDIARLFKPFVQLDSSLTRQQSGTGLGLALVQRMVAMHGGSVSVNSDPGKGSRFTASLPWQGNREVEQPEDDSTHQIRPESKETPKPKPVNQEPKTILVVEDSELVIMFVTDYLINKGYHVESAKDGIEALEKINLYSPDLVFMDVQMPRMDGLETTRQIRKDPQIADTKVVIMSAMAMPGDRERCLEAGADDYLSKPVSLKMVISTIERYVNG